MKKALLSILTVLLASVVLLSACSKNQNAGETTAVESAATASNSATSDSAAYDPYAVKNRYDIPEEMFQKRSGVDYGTLLKDVSYYSTVAGDDKQVNILLPAGYD